MGLRLEDVQFQGSGFTLLSYLQDSPMAPAGWRRQVFEAVHSLSELGVKAFLKLMGVIFV